MVRASERPQEVWFSLVSWRKTEGSQARNSDELGGEVCRIFGEPGFGKHLRFGSSSAGAFQLNNKMSRLGRWARGLPRIRGIEHFQCSCMALHFSALSDVLSKEGPVRAPPPSRVSDS